jgi:exodeoxyribonuclease III
VLYTLVSVASPHHSLAFRIASWNVAGLRAVLTKTPEAFANLVRRHDLDVLCLQETKLQESHVNDPKLKIRETMAIMADYDDYWSCSTTKKGYSGTAVFVRRRAEADSAPPPKRDGGGGGKQTRLDQFVAKSAEVNESITQAALSTTSHLPIPSSLLIPEEIGYKMGKVKHDDEGRIITMDYPLFSLCNVYVPNSGQALARLAYRTDEWDVDLLALMQAKQAERKVPVIWLGDLNVAHTHLEVWNDGAKHLPKQAGVTPQERASFSAQLDNGNFVDAFRRLHPTASGHYSYWSTRAGNRVTNKGLRLDYFICDPALFDESSNVIVRDCYMDYEQEGSDHCPVILELEIKSNSQ